MLQRKPKHDGLAQRQSGAPALTVELDKNSMERGDVRLHACEWPGRLHLNGGCLRTTEDGRGERTRLPGQDAFTQHLEFTQVL